MNEKEIKELVKMFDSLYKDVEDPAIRRMLPSARAAAAMRELLDEVKRLRRALRGVFKPDGVPYAQWPPEWHAADAALKKTKRGR